MMKALTLFVLLLTSVTSFGQEKRIKKQSEFTNCQLVEKAFINKRGDVTEHMELYLRCSMDDYFIKLCESKVTREELEKYIDQGISVKMELHEGEWDRCLDDEYPVQSRIGTYAVITYLVE